MARIIGPKRHGWPWCHRISHVYCFGEATQRLTHHRNHLCFVGFFWGAPEKSTWKKLDFEGNLWLLKFILYSFVIFYVVWIQMLFCKSLGAFILIGISLHFRCLFCLVFLWRFLNPSNSKIQAPIHPEWILFNHNISPNLKSNIIFQLIPSLKPLADVTSHFWPRLRFCPSVNLANLNVELLVPGTSIIQPNR